MKDGIIASKDNEINDLKSVRMEFEVLLQQTESDRSIIASRNSKLEDENLQLISTEKQQRASQEILSNVIRDCVAKLSSLDLGTRTMDLNNTLESPVSSEPADSDFRILYEYVEKTKSAFLDLREGKRYIESKLSLAESKFEDTVAELNMSASADGIKVTSLTARCEELDTDLKNERAAVQDLLKQNADLLCKLDNATEATEAKQAELNRLEHQYENQLAQAETSLNDKKVELTTFELRLKEAHTEYENNLKELENRHSEKYGKLTMELERKNLELENVLSELQQQKSSHNLAMDKSATEMECLRREVTKLNDDLRQKACECGNMRHELQQQKNYLDLAVKSAKDESEELRSKYANLLVEFDECRHLHSAELSEVNARHSSTEKTMRIQIFDMQTIISRLESDNSALQEAAFETVSRLEKNVVTSRLQETKKSLELQAVQEQFSNAEIKSQCYSQSMQTALNKAETELARVVDHAKVVNEHLVFKQNQLSSEVELLIRYQKRSTMVNQVELNGLRKLVHEKSDVIRALEQKLKARDSERCEIEQRHTSNTRDLFAQVETLRANLERTESARVAANQEASTVSQRLKDVESEVVVLSEACTVRDAECEELARDICRLRDELTLELETANDEVAVAHKSLDDTREEVRTLKERLELSTQGFLSLDASLADAIPVYVSSSDVTSILSSADRMHAWRENFVKTVADTVMEARDLNAKVDLSERQVGVLQKSVEAKNESLRVYEIKHSAACEDLKESNRKCQSLSEALKKYNSLFSESEESAQKAISALHQRHKTDLAKARETYEGARAAWREAKAVLDGILRMLHVTTSNVLSAASLPPVTSNGASDLKLQREYAESLISNVGTYMTEMQCLKDSLHELESANEALTNESKGLVDELAVLKSKLVSEEAELKEKSTFEEELYAKLLSQTAALDDATNRFEEYKRAAEASGAAQCQFISRIENERSKMALSYEHELGELNKQLSDSYVENGELRKKSERLLGEYESLAQENAFKIENLHTEKQDLEMNLVQAFNIIKALGKEIKDLSDGTNQFLQLSDSVAQQRQEALDRCEYLTEVLESMKAAKQGAEDSLKAALHDLELKRASEKDWKLRCLENENDVVEKGKIVSSLGDKIAQLEGDSSLLRSKLSTVLAEKEEEASRNVALQNEMCELEQVHDCRVAELNEIVNTVRGKNDQLEGGIRSVFLAFEGVTSDVKATVKDSVETEEKCRLVGEAIVEWNGRISHLLQTVCGLQAKLSDRDVTLASLTTEKNDLTSAVQEHKRNLDIFKENFAEAQKRISSLTEALDEAQRDHEKNLSSMCETNEKAQRFAAESKVQNATLIDTNCELEAQIVDLKSQLSSLNTQTQLKEKELSALTVNAEKEKCRRDDELAKLREEIEKMEHHNKRLDKSSSQSEASLKKKCEDIAALNRELCGLRDGHKQELEDLRLSLRQQAESFKEDNAKHQDELKTVLQSKADLETVLREKTLHYENTALQLECEMKALSEKMEESKRESDHTTSDLRLEVQQATKLRDEIKARQGRAERLLEEEREAKEALVTSLHEMKERHETEVSSLRESLTATHADTVRMIQDDFNKQLTSASTVADEQISRLKNELDGAKSELHALQVEFEKSSEKNLENMQRVERELALKAEKLERALSACEALEQSKKARENELSEEKAEVSRLRNLLEETGDELREKRSSEQKLMERIETLQNSISAVNERSDRTVRELQSKIDEGEATVAELHQKLDNIRSELDKTVREHDETHQSMVSYKRANEGLHQDLLLLKSAMKDDEQATEMKLGKMMDEHNRLRANLEAKGVEVANLSKKIEAKEMALVSMETCRKSAEAALAEVKKELEVSTEKHQIRVEDLESLASDSARKCEKLRENLTLSQAELRKAEKAQDERSAKVRALEEELQRLNLASASIPSLKSEVRQLKEDLTKSASELHEKQREIVELRASKMADGTDSSKSELELLQAAQEESIAKQAELNAEIASLQDVCNRSDQAAGMYQKMMKKHAQCMRKLRRYVQLEEQEKRRKKAQDGKEVTTDENERSGKSNRLKRRALSLAPSDMTVQFSKKARQSVGGVGTKVPDSNRGPMKNVTDSYMNY